MNFFRYRWKFGTSRAAPGWPELKSIKRVLPGKWHGPATGGRGISSAGTLSEDVQPPGTLPAKDVAVPGHWQMCSSCRNHFPPERLIFGMCPMCDHLMGEDYGDDHETA